MGYQFPNLLQNLSYMHSSAYSSCNIDELWPLCTPYSDLSYRLGLGYLMLPSINCLTKGVFSHLFLSFFRCLNQEIYQIKTSQRQIP
jgi:hypothetical protein